MRHALVAPRQNETLPLSVTNRQLIEQIQQHEQSKARLQLAMDAAQLGWWQYDPLHRVVLGDTRSHQIFDVTADETPIEEIMKRVHPDDVEKVQAAVGAVLDPTHPEPCATEFRLQGDGEVRWVEAHGLTHFEGAPRERRAVSTVGIAQDITDRKRRDEQLYLLMREVNHRAKNMLSGAGATLGGIYDRLLVGVSPLSDTVISGYVLVGMGAFLASVTLCP